MITKKIIVESCEKDDCCFHTSVELTLGDDYAEGQLIHRHCLICKYLKTDNNFYTRLVIGD